MSSPEKKNDVSFGELCCDIFSHNSTYLADIPNLISSVPEKHNIVNFRKLCWDIISHSNTFLVNAPSLTTFVPEKKNYFTITIPAYTLNKPVFTAGRRKNVISPLLYFLSVIDCENSIKSFLVVKFFFKVELPSYVIIIPLLPF